MCGSKMKNPGMACDECTKKCLKLHVSRESVGSTSESLSFFKIMLGAFETTLFLPPKCSCKMLKLVNQIAYLEDSEGSSWRVEISLINNLLTFQEGWHEFIKDHNIKIGEMVMFKYLGSLKFSVQIFGTSGCERVQFPVKESCNASKSKRNREGSPSDHFHSHKCDASSILEEKSFIPNDGSSKRKKTVTSMQTSHIFENGDISLKSSYQAEQFHRSESPSVAKCTEAHKSNRSELPSAEKYTEAHKSNRPEPLSAAKYSETHKNNRSEPPSAEKCTEAQKSNRSEPPSAEKYTEAQKSNRSEPPSAEKYTVAHKSNRPEPSSAEKYTETHKSNRSEPPSEAKYTETQKSNFMSNEFVDHNKSRKTKKYAKRCYGTRESSSKETNIPHQQNANVFVKVFPGLEKEGRKPDYGHLVASMTHHLSVEQHKHNQSEVVHNQGITNNNTFEANVAPNGKSTDFSAAVGKDDEMTPVSVVEDNCTILVTESGTCILVDTASVVSSCPYTVACVDTLLTEETILSHPKNSREQSTSHPRMEGITSNTSNTSAELTCKIPCIMDGEGIATLGKDKFPFLESDPNSLMLVSKCIGICFPGGNFKDDNKFLSFTFTSEALQEEDSWDIQFCGTPVAENCGYPCVEGDLNSTMIVHEYHKNHGAASSPKDNIMLVDADRKDPLPKDGGEIECDDVAPCVGSTTFIPNFHGNFHSERSDNDEKDKSPLVGTDPINSTLVPACNGSTFPGGNSKDGYKFLSSTSYVFQKEDSRDIRLSGTPVAENDSDPCLEGDLNSTVIVHEYHENHDAASCPKDNIMLVDAACKDPLSKDGGGIGKDKIPLIETDPISSILVPECNGSSFPEENSKDGNKFLSSTSDASQKKDSWDIRSSGTPVAENDSDPCLEGALNSTVIVHGYHENHDVAICPKDSIMLIDAACKDPLSKDGGGIEYDGVASCVENTTVTPDFHDSFDAKRSLNGGKDNSPHIGTDLISSTLVPECNESSFPGENSKDGKKFLSSTSEASQKKDSWDIQPSGTPDPAAENDSDPCVESVPNSAVVVHGYHKNHDAARCLKDSIILIDAACKDPLSKDGGGIEPGRTFFTEYGDVASCVESTTVTPDFQGSFNAERSHNDVPKVGVEIVSCYPQEKVWDAVNIETTDSVMLPPSDQVKFSFPLSADIRPWHELSEPLPSKKKRHERRVVFFRDSLARVWPVLYHESTRFVGFLGGWQPFASSQNIEEGDTCMLEMVDESESTFNAIVCKK